MFRTIFEKELRETIGTTKFAVTFAICSILILLSFFVGARNFEVAQARYEAAVSENLGRMSELTDWREVDNHRIFLPPKPLESLVSGVSNDIGRTVQITGRGELSAVDSRFSEDPLFAVFRFLDLEFLFAVVFSLFAILFAFDAVNGEKERGTLRLISSTAVPRDAIIFGKLAGAFVALALPLLIPVLIGCLMLILLDVPMSGDSWLRLALVLLAGFLYFGAFLSLSVWISTLTHRSSSSFLVLLVLWIVSVMIVPRTAVLLAGRAVDVPNLDAINTQKGIYRSQLWEDDRSAMSAFRPSDMSEDSDPQKMMEEFNAFMTKLADEREDKMSVFNERLNEERENRLRVQQRLTFSIARISPTAVFTLASTRLSGTSIELKDQYLDAADVYQEGYGQFMVGKTGQNMGGWLPDDNAVGGRRRTGADRPN